MQLTALSWLYLVGAAFCQMAWTYSLKYLRVDALKVLNWATFYRLDGGLVSLVPWIVYVVAGIINSVLLAMAMRVISSTTAFAVWMAVTLLFIKTADVYWLKNSWSLSELFFLLLITVGIVGLKLVGPAQ
ncbi:DMT family transporter [Spirosoma agri]|uniref:Uncharacterized protein n=1 Tax=Spirosoma agri TaxID=1987381 RepID=A0A6M0IFQ2_9BACT|nr:SMR family transporter [Spirosoma agri]NEU66968.1 hypothetical protein [Spirosoma agri]